MRSLQDIKTRKEDKGDTSKPFREFPVKKSVLHIRETKPDLVQKQIDEKLGTSKKYDREIDSKRQTLNRLDDEVLTKKKEVESNVDEILVKAKAQAKEIIEKAQLEQKEVDTLRDKAHALSKTLQTKEKGLGEKEGRLINREKATEAERVNLSERELKITGSEKATGQKLEQASKLLVDLVSIFSVGLEKVTSLVTLEGETREEIREVLSQAEKLYNETEKKETLLKADRQFLDDKQKEIDVGFEQLKDARRALKMVKKELGVK